MWLVGKLCASWLKSQFKECVTVTFFGNWPLCSLCFSITCCYYIVAKLHCHYKSSDSLPKWLANSQTQPKILSFSVFGHYHKVLGVFWGFFLGCFLFLFSSTTQQTLTLEMCLVHSFISGSVWNMCAKVQMGKLFLLITFDLSKGLCFAVLQLKSYSHLSERKQTGFLKLRSGSASQLVQYRKSNSISCSM